MGREYHARSATDADWATVAERLRRSGESPVVKMIDGMPAFPDEVPEPGWRELRLGFASGMVTIRRTADGYSCVVWGTADEALVRAAEACAAAFGEPPS